MRIEKDQIIAGHSALFVRDFLRKVKTNYFNVEAAAGYLKKSNAETKIFLGSLQKEDLVEEENLGAERFWTCTDLGSTLSLATAAKPLLRKTADKKLEEFLERVHELNSNERYPYKVTKVILFGSYITDKERINDVDIGFEYTQKSKDEDEFKRMCELSVQKAKEHGKQLTTYMDQLYWPYQEMLLFLKSRSRVISLHEASADGLFEKLEDSEKRVVFEEDAS